MVILQKFSSAVLRSLRVVSAILGVVIGNIALNTLSSQHPIWIWLPLALLSIFLLVFPLLIKRELNNRPLEERQFTPKQIYSGIGLGTFGYYFSWYLSFADGERCRMAPNHYCCDCFGYLFTSFSDT